MQGGSKAVIQMKEIKQFFHMMLRTLQYFSNLNVRFLNVLGLP